MSADEATSDREQSDANQVVNAGKLDQLIESTDKMTASNNRLALAMVEYQERARLAARRFRITMLALGVITFVAFGAVAAALYAGLLARNQIADCVTSTGHCYQQEQTRTAELVSGLVAAIVSNDQQIAARAAACAPDYVNLPSRQRTHAIYVCIVRSK